MLPRFKCNHNFQSQYAFIDKKSIHIDEYKKEYRNKIKCNKGHDLVMCEGSIRKKYFRHKNNNDIENKPMTEWHCRMQGYFPITEKYFKSKEGQIKSRTADIVIQEHNHIIEIQHSKIAYAEVYCRNLDYTLHNMTVVWIIDGNTEDVILEQLTTGNFLIIFNEDWKYKSFKESYDYVILDIKDKFFKIPVKNVSNKMILLKEWKPIDFIMDKLKTNPKDIWNEWEDDNEIKCSLTVVQKGAGNGKTYGIWKSISNNFDKEVYIIVTKQKSAVEVIRKELEDQAKSNELHIIDNIPDRDTYKTFCNKTIITYEHKKSNRKCKVVIGTIDSLAFNLTHVNKSFCADFFKDVLDTIHKYGCTKINRSSSSFQYGGENFKLDQKTELWIDEAQDLNRDYFYAIVKLMLQQKIDTVIVGDKLQSLQYPENIMTCVEEEIPNISINRLEPINQNRRIKVEGMAEIINDLVHYKQYNLPEITFEKNIEESLIKRDESPVEIIETENIFENNTVKENEKRSKLVDKIIEIVKKEVETHNYLPEDFLFLFPFMAKNLIATELETKLNNFWINKYKYKYNNKYNVYAVVHKSDEYKPIDMSKSKNAARLVSIMTSKGDGRKVVFVINCTEKSLKKVSQTDNINIIYESYLNVALTRAKEKTYFCLVKNNDDIHKRFCNVELVEYKPKIKTNIPIHNIIDHLDKDKIIEILKNNNISGYIEQTENTQIKNNVLIDWEYHCIRRAISLIYIIFNIFKENSYNGKIEEKFRTKSQLVLNLHNIQKLEIKGLTSDEFYNYLNRLDKLDNLDYMPICRYPNDKIREIYFDKIKYAMKDITKKYNNNYYELGKLSPKESIILWYMIQLYRHKQYTEIAPTTLYNIIDYFENEDGHKTSEFLNEANSIKEVTKKVMKEILSPNTNIEWNIEHMIKMYGNTDDFNIIMSNIPIIGNSSDYIYHIKYTTDLNSLNYWNIMIEILIERFTIRNPSDKGKDIVKFKDKPIKTYVLILKQNDYKLIDWDWDKELTQELKELLKRSITKHFSSFNNELIRYYSFIKNQKILWEQKHKSPLDFVSNEFKDTNYVRDYFKNLHTTSLKSKADKDYIINLTKSDDKFCEHLTEHIEEMCDSFFGLNIVNDTDEW